MILVRNREQKEGVLWELHLGDLLSILVLGHSSSPFFLWESSRFGGAG